MTDELRDTHRRMDMRSKIWTTNMRTNVDDFTGPAKSLVLERSYEQIQWLTCTKFAHFDLYPLRIATDGL